MGRRNHFHMFPSYAVNCEKKPPKSLFCSESLIAKIYSTKIPSSARALDSLPPPRKMPSINFYPPTKQQFSCYNPIKTSFLAVVVAPVPFPF